MARSPSRGPEGAGGQPLFILTCMRSFSSLASSMLGQHPGLYGLPEINPFIAGTLGASVDLLRAVRRRTLDGLYRAVAEIERGAQDEAAVREAQGWVDARRDWGPVRLMDHLASRLAPRRLIEKSPSTALRAERVATAIRLFPEARFLHLHRHPVATCASIARIAGGNAGKAGARAAMTRDPEESWLGTNGAIVEAAQALPPERFMSIRGEDLLASPDAYLAQVCEWLGLPAGPGEIAAMRRPEESPFAFVGPPSAPFGNDPNFLRDPAFVQREVRLPRLDAPLDWAGGRRLRPATVALAQRLGYGDGD